MAEWAPRARPLKSTAEVMATAGFTASNLDACSVRCGIGDLKPVREAVYNMLRGSVVPFCGIVPAFILRVCFERAIALVDGMLVGFTRRALHRYTILRESFLLRYWQGFVIFPNAAWFYCGMHSTQQAVVHVRKCLQNQNPKTLLCMTLLCMGPQPGAVRMTHGPNSTREKVECTVSARFWHFARSSWHCWTTFLLWCVLIRYYAWPALNRQDTGCLHVFHLTFSPCLEPGVFSGVFALSHLCGCTSRKR